MWSPNKTKGEDAIDWVWTTLHAARGPISYAYVLKRFTSRPDLYKGEPADTLHRIFSRWGMHKAQDGMIRRIKSTGERTGDIET